MAITGIEIIRLSIPFETGGPRHGIRPGMAPWTRMESLLLRVDTQDGVHGWGEAFGHFINPATAAVLETLAGPWLLGRDEADIAGIADAAQRAFFGFGRNGPVMYALSAIDIALWDLAARRAGLPLHRYLGGTRTALTRYASLVRYGTPEVVARKVAEAVDRGFTLVKLHESDSACFAAAVEAAAGRARIALDVNCRWTPAEAASVCAQLSDPAYAWLEEPVWPPEDYASLAALRGRGVAIAAGENAATLHDIARLLQAGAVDILQPSAVKLGGLTALREAQVLARAHGVRCLPHCYTYGPGYAATAHALAALPRPELLETAYVDLEHAPCSLFAIDDAALTLPDAVGLGFDPDPGSLDRHAIWRTHLRAH